MKIVIMIVQISRWIVGIDLIFQADVIDWT